MCLYATRKLRTFKLRLPSCTPLYFKIQVEVEDVLFAANALSDIFDITALWNSFLTLTTARHFLYFI